MIIDDNYSFRIDEIMSADTDNFAELVRLANLNSLSDFVGAPLEGVDFSNSELSNFNFEYADLRRVNWENIKSNPKSVRKSLRGDGYASVRGSNFDYFREVVLSKKNWSERFYAFKLLVDNWGENLDTADVLKSVLMEDKGTYLPLNAYVYFMASYFGNNQAKQDCVKMADYGSSSLNLYRLKRTRKSARDFKNYASQQGIKGERYPDDLTPQTVERLNIAARHLFGGIEIKK